MFLVPAPILFEINCSSICRTMLLVEHLAVTRIATRAAAVETRKEAEEAFQKSRIWSSLHQPRRMSWESRWKTRRKLWSPHSMRPTRYFPKLVAKLWLDVHFLPKWSYGAVDIRLILFNGILFVVCFLDSLFGTNGLNCMAATNTAESCCFFCHVGI